MKPAGRTTATTVALTSACGMLSATAPASAAVNCASPVYKRQFYANTTFSGQPKKTDCDSAVNENWGTGAPAKGLPKDKFGVRWTVTRNFGSGGPFAFAVAVQDGIRVYLDGRRKVDLWKNVSSTVSRTVNVTIPSGTHTLRVDYVNWTGRANVKFGYAPRTSASVDKVRPLAPAGLTVSYDKNTGKARATWVKNKEMDLAGYRLYRRPEGNGSWTRLTTTTATSATDTPPPTGQVFSYQVRAYDKAGNESTGSTDRPVTTVDTTPPAPPGGVDRNWTFGRVTTVNLTWDSSPDPDLAGYRVYRSTSSPVAPTAGNRVGETGPTTRWTETPPPTGDFYYYVVTAVDIHGNESAASGTAWYQTYDTTAPTVLPEVTAVDGEYDVTLTWPWQWDPASPLSGYAVYRDGKRIGNARYGDDGSGYFVDTSVERSTTYTYWVLAIDDASNGGPVAQVTVDHVGDYTAPAPVTGLTATAAGNGILLEWDGSTATDFDHYRVYRGVYADGAWTYTDITRTLDGHMQPRRLDRNLPDGESLRYAVVAVDRAGNALDVASAPSVAVTELDLRPPQTWPDSSDILYTRADNQAEGNSVRVSYTPSLDPRGPAIGFLVDRWDPAAGTWVRITATPVTGTQWYLDTTAPSDTTVFYRSTVAYPDGTESAPVGTHAFT
ncbi:PA14 domain-containing protein [Streptomyces sp. NPDC001698]|uniref:PA14 domain-containing protein n=1 Tax=Streptomyces sp. NPDC001698 TaxID=3364601 RepID=UPI0036CB88D1